MTANYHEQEIFEAIKENHRLSLERQMAEHTTNFNRSNHSERVDTWVNKLSDIRRLSDGYLSTIAQSPYANTEETIAQNTTFSAYFSGIGKAVLPERLSKALFDSPYLQSEETIFSHLTSAFFSIALGRSITDLLMSSYTETFSTDPVDKQKQFKEIIDEQSSLSKLISAECERISIELIKLFHFREMLLMGKLSAEPREPDARANFIAQAGLQKVPKSEINSAINIYFIRELSKIFNTSFTALYKVQAFEVNAEGNSALKDWFHHLFNSHNKRLIFTQQIQLRFMLMSIDFLLEQKNEPSFFAKHPIITSVLAGLIAGFVLSLALAFVLNTLFVVAIALVGTLLAAVGAFFLTNKMDYFAYKRHADNRSHIQDTIDRIDTEYLALNNEVAQLKETSEEFIKDTRKFSHVNHTLLSKIEGKHIARGSVAGWLREYASRYRLSHVIEVDLEREYKTLIEQSNEQNNQLIEAINKNNPGVLKLWIQDTQNYLKQADHKKGIAESEIIPKIKEQVLEIIGQSNYIPPLLINFYSKPIEQGGLGGSESDFAHFQRLAPSESELHKMPNPYSELCNVALNLFTRCEPKFLDEPFLYGDAEYRYMLGISGGNPEVTITSSNIDRCLKNSYSFLLSLCSPIKPGPNIDPLKQSAQVSDEFVLYRMLLLKQLANLCSLENKSLDVNAKHRIQAFVKRHFHKDPDVVFDDLINQKFLVNKTVQSSATFRNRDGFEVNASELDNIIQAIGLDFAYNSVNIKLNDVLNFFMDEYSHKHSIPTEEYFVRSLSEQEIAPQCTQQYVNKIRRYCHNTVAFLKAGEKNKALTTTNILECYRYNVSLQVYKAQLRILKSLKDLKSETMAGHFHEEKNHLVKAFKRLDHFAKIHCFALQKNSPLRTIGHYLKDKELSPKLVEEWIDQLDSSEQMVKHLDQIAEQLRAPLQRLKVVKKPQFFNKEDGKNATEAGCSQPTAACPPV